jgi:regulation of enolase protein 1 (concanavalin A-like superfamily)
VFDIPPHQRGRDFEASVAIQGQYRQLFDQACLFIRLVPTQGQETWVKAGVEREDDINWVGSVVTTQWSDWAIAAQPSVDSIDDSTSVRFHFLREGHLLKIRTSSYNPRLAQCLFKSLFQRISLIFARRSEGRQRFFPRPCRCDSAITNWHHGSATRC